MGIEELIALLGAGVETVSHISQLLGKLQAENRTQATADELSALADAKARQAQAEKRWLDLLPAAQ